MALLAALIAAAVGTVANTAAAQPFAAGRATSQWRPIGPYGGSVRVLAADGAGAIYAGTSYAGVFRSDDGVTWTPARAGLPSGTILDLEADPVAAGVVLAITSAGLARSSDGGASWTAITLRGNPYLLAISPSAHLTVYAIGIPSFSSRAALLHRSDDGGSTWRPVAADLPRDTIFNAFVADPRAAGVLYGSTGHGVVWKSADGGAHWTGVQAADPHSVIGALAIDPTQPAVVYAAPLEPLHLLKSVDGGATWTAIPIPVLGTFVALAVDPHSPSTLIGAASLINIVGSAGPYHGIFKSTDGGHTWVKLVTDPALPEILALDKLSSLLLSPLQSGHYYAGTLNGPGVLASRDGGDTWMAVNQGLAAETVSKVTPDPFAPGTLYAALSSGIAKSTDSGVTWAAADVGLTFLAPLGPEGINEVTADPATPNLLYAAGDGALGRGVLRSQDGGASWNPIDPGFSVNGLAIDPRRPLWLYAAGSGPKACVGLPPNVTCFGSPRASLSRDGGVTWSEIPRIERPDTGAFAAVRLSPVHPQTVYAVGTRCFKSINGGRNWRRLPLPAPPSGGEISITDLAIDPAAPQTLYAAHAAGEILKSLDGGTTFALAGALPASVVPTGFAMDPTAPGLVYVGTTAGVFRSADGGATWNRFGVGLDAFTALSLTLDPRPPATLYAATLGGGIFALDLSPAGSGATVRP